VIFFRCKNTLFGKDSHICILEEEKASPYFVSLQRNNAKGELFFSYNENVTR
jgi:hypothetical protein